MRVLLFDLDDTLVPSSEAYDQAQRLLGIDPDGERYQIARAEVKQLCPIGYPAARSRRLYFKRYLELADEYTPSRHLEFVTVYENEVARLLGEAWRKFERPALFAKLQANTDVIGIVSNESAAMQSLKLAQMDSDWLFFDFILTSEETGVEKPNARIFTRALELAVAYAKHCNVKANDCVFVGDSFEMDIVPSLALGMRAIQTTEFQASSEKRHSICISKLDEIVALF